MILWNKKNVITEQYSNFFLIAIFRNVRRKEEKNTYFLILSSHRLQQILFLTFFNWYNGHSEIF